MAWDTPALIAGDMGALATGGAKQLEHEMLNGLAGAEFGQNSEVSAP